MLSSGLVVVSLLLATHGDEGSREEKFRGALLAQNAAPVATVSDTTAIKREIALLTIERPTLTAPIAIIIVGGGLATLGGILFLVGVAVAGWNGVGLFVLGLASVAVGGLGIIIGLISLAVTASVREHTDERLKKLNEQLKATTPQQSTPAVEWLVRPPAPLTLARF